MSTDSKRLKAVERYEVEDRLHQEYGIALGRHGFDACSNWEGKERCEKTVWNALVDARLKLRAAERALQMVVNCWDTEGPWGEVAKVAETVLAEIRRSDGK